ncbi:MAG TPA: hypothetical protein PK228_14565 [Saprospiraceae bacterium]|nr:hypothetical protein [Saprospiraceae bacterium]
MEITLPDVNFEMLSFEKIKALYPDEWVLIGNPELREPDVQEAVVRKLVRGVVVLHGKDRREVAYQSKYYRQYFNEFAFVWTGEIPKNRKFLL